VYNSDSVNVKPIVQVSLPSDNSKALPCTISAQLTSNGVAGATRPVPTGGAWRPQGQRAIQVATAGLYSSRSKRAHSADS
jgi:hypothetical protein